MARFTVCFAATGGIEIEAKDEDSARDKFWNECLEDAFMELGENGISITEVFEEAEDGVY